MPLFVKVDIGTSYFERWEINPFTLYLISCGWEIETVVLPPLGWTK